MDGDTTARVLYLTLLLLAVSGALVSGLRQRFGQTLQQVLIWGFIFLGLIAGYGLWPDIERGLYPRSAVVGDGTVELRRAEDGHFYAEAEVNGRALLFLIDTGASDIVLSREDAARVGIDMAALNFDGFAETANGTVPTARVRLDSLSLGSFADRDVPARVNGGALQGSLLGMRYLDGFTLRIDGDRLLLSR